jgi:hypothetical protein
MECFLQRLFPGLGYGTVLKYTERADRNDFELLLCSNCILSAALLEVDGV